MTDAGAAGTGATLTPPQRDRRETGGRGGQTSLETAASGGRLGAGGRVSEDLPRGREGERHPECPVCTRTANRAFETG